MGRGHCVIHCPGCGSRVVVAAAAPSGRGGDLGARAPSARPRHRLSHPSRAPPGRHGAGRNPGVRRVRCAASAPLGLGIRRCPSPLAAGRRLLGGPERASGEGAGRAPPPPPRSGDGSGLAERGLEQHEP